MIETPVTILLVAVAAIGALAAFTRRKPSHAADAERTEQLAEKLSDAACEADQHIAAYLRSEHKRGDRHG